MTGTLTPTATAAPRHYKDKENSLRFIMEMLDIELQVEDEQPQAPLEILLSSWVTVRNITPLFRLTQKKLSVELKS